MSSSFSVVSGSVVGRWLSAVVAVVVGVVVGLLQLGGDAWKSGVTRMLEDPNKRVLFNLGGVDVWPGVTRAASGRGGATGWELLQIRSNSYPNLEFWQAGQRVGNPFE